MPGDCGPFTGDWRLSVPGKWGRKSPGVVYFAGFFSYPHLVDGVVIAVNSPRN